MSILVITELEAAGGFHKMSWEAVTAAQQLAAGLAVPLHGAVIGAGAAEHAPELASKKLDAVSVVEHDLLNDYTAEGFAAAFASLVEQLSPRIVVLPHTYQVRDFAPKLAARLGCPLVSDVVEIRVEDGAAVYVRQLFQGKMNADVSVDGLAFVSVQSGSFRGDQAATGESPAPISQVEAAIDPTTIRVRPGERFQESKGDVDLTAADIIVSVGRGIKDPENIPLAEKLAALLGGELAASRPICDSGWLPLERQVGSSGQSVTPKLYLALGISGAIQHVVGMKGAQTIVAINKDESAPLFEIADYGIVGDLFEVVPALISELEK